MKTKKKYKSEDERAFRGSNLVLVLVLVLVLRKNQKMHVGVFCGGMESTFCASIISLSKVA